jgi:hypothetical protein
MDDVAPVSSENAMIMVFSCHCITPVSTFAQTVKFSPVIPASWLLAKITADGPLVPKLGTGGGSCSLGEGRISFLDHLAPRHIGQGCQCPDSQSAVVAVADTVQLF